MELRRQTLSAEILHPAHDFEPVVASVEVRWDPLTGHAARLVKSRAPLLPTSSFDLGSLAEETRSNCIFCPERVERVTPKLPVTIHPEGRIKRGQALLFPNILAYSQYSSVSIYSPKLHHLPLDRMTPELIADNVAAQVDYISAVMAFDPGARWASINANHMLPSGSSLFHPHMQSSVDPVPSTVQDLLAGAPGQRYRDYIDTERRLGERYIGSTGTVDWMTSFAPIGFNEVRAFVAGAASPEQLSNEQVGELGLGIARVLQMYAQLGCQSFNLALYGAPPETDGCILNLRIVSRSNLQPLYRSDSTYFERLHWQAMIDTSPEELAAAARPIFAV